MTQVPHRLDETEKTQQKFMENLTELQDRTSRRVRFETFKKERADVKRRFDEVHRQLEDRTVHAVRRGEHKVLEHDLDQDSPNLEDDGGEDDREAQDMVFDQEDDQEQRPVDYQVEIFEENGDNNLYDYDDIDLLQKGPPTTSSDDGVAESDDDVAESNDGEDFSVWLDDHGDLQTNVQDPDDTWNDLLEVWVKQKAEFENKNKDWLSVDLKKLPLQCLRTVVFPRTQRWTKSSPGAYAYSTTLELVDTIGLLAMKPYLPLNDKIEDSEQPEVKVVVFLA
ncbi:hypothetical protein M436DRAFT_82677 [Aureobasidium namibiae CBS 147.97]|uniref:Uncharacterized protein n=1 Tax=Aureobasidium namibiae CBS 147.97 TaxID=1043004 RepID=A0A074WHQ7_9PEZI